jgi:type 1 glutamine amidotransferase
VTGALAATGPESEDARAAGPAWPKAWPGVRRQAGYRIRVFTRTTGYRHDSIPDAILALRTLGAEHGFEVEQTEDPAVLTDAQLASYAAIVFLMTTGDVLDDGQQAAIEGYIRAGGGFVGVHSACDTEYDWPWYGQLVGAYFEQHPEIQPAIVQVEDGAHPSTAGLPERWQRTDEWYDVRRNPRGQVRVLLRLDESTYQGGGMGTDHPIAWCHEYDGGRSWYTALGHTPESYREPLFLGHLLGGIRYAAGEASADGAGMGASATRGDGPREGT